ncbi:putative sugar transferase [Selenomonas ruminantium subsp. lactilytica TAM6421]|uniref:Putative sugar transferase n=1 Tax=Selenomonas ruminantium subsp. lactilytica (strain NBRC 103574 / TAM6421) TaxID=927704 RepID=I0GRQ8_SELRL|nr:sugar transferase [Selenomonas ruminantium]BAL83445.1 putative sugar transferase [Selenomonas ruminantium subsp. lactilytica TAM6421]
MSNTALQMNYILKRIFDICSAGITLLLLLPLFVVIAIAIKLDSEGPVIFSQGRRTKNGKIFQMYKFRSMVVNAEKVGTGLFNYENDPRVTKVGRFLRNSSLDELPQLFNVFKGDISVVGPRPCVTYELGDYETLNKKYKKRFTVIGGITGLAQARGRNENSWDEKVTLDNQYIDEFKQRGILLDFQIIWETLMKVFHKADIYEEKVEGAQNDVESAQLAEAEIIRIAHLPDEE